MNLWSMSVSGGIFIIAIVVVRSLLRNRLPGKVFQVLWFAVFLRLMVPFSIPCPFSVYSLAEKLSVEFSSDGTLGNHTAELAGAAAEMSGNKVSGEGVAANAEDKADMDLKTVCLAVYLCGVFLCILYYVSSYIRCYREFAASLPIEEAKVQEWDGELPLRRKVSVRQWEGVGTPLAYGMFHPVILLPKSLVKADAGQMRFVLLHEYMHIRHFDTVKKFFLILSCCVHWFNPLVWVMCILANRDMEIACDENVIGYLGRDSRAAYAYVLIDMEEQRGVRFSFGNSFCKNAMEERVVAIMKEKKKSIAIGVLSGVLTAGIIMVFATSAFAFAQTEKTVYVDTAYAGEAVHDDYAAEEGDRSYVYAEETTEMIDSAAEVHEVYEDEAVANEYDTDEAVNVLNVDTAADSALIQEETITDSEVAIEKGRISDSAENVDIDDESVKGVSVVINGAYEGNSTPDIPAEYASFGITVNQYAGTWIYQGKEVAVFYDRDRRLMTSETSEKNAVYLQVCRDKNGDIEEIKELSKKEMQKLLKSTGLVF